MRATQLESIRHTNLERNRVENVPTIILLFGYALLPGGK